MPATWILVAVCAGMLALIGGVTFLSQNYSLNGIKDRTVGDGQHGTARWATKKEIHDTYSFVPFQPALWRKGKDLPKVQGVVLGCVGGTLVKKASRFKVVNKLREKNPLKKKIKPVAMKAIVDSDDIHCLMIPRSCAVCLAGGINPFN